MSSADSECVLEASGLARRYPRRDPDQPEFALESFDLRLVAGEALVLAGGNGAGKSTALRILAGIETPDQGRVRCFGSSPRSAESRRRIGYLSDQSELFPFLDWKETLLFFAAARSTDRKEAKRRCEDWGERFGLRAYGKKRVAAFSLGMRRRLGLASVLVGDPDLLLLDEPTSGLDPEGMQLFDEVMREQRDVGKTIVLSSHHLGHSGALCDRLIALRRGRIVAEGSLEDLALKLDGRDLSVRGLDAEILAELEAFIRNRGGEIERNVLAETALARLLSGDNESISSAREPNSDG